jgi:RimJ/RimL family protein N-acetyltransferase
VTSADLPGSVRLRFEHVGLSRARRILDGDLIGLDPAPGWPQPGTEPALRREADRTTSDEETLFLVFLAATGQVVGDAGWHGPPDANGVVEIGYGLAPSVHGQGLGTELVGALTAWALGQPGCSVVHAYVLPDNVPSLRALARNGFTVGGQEGDYLVLTLGAAVVTGE